MAESRWIRLAAPLLAAVLASHCSGCPRDPDSMPKTAQGLPLDEPRLDSLDCGNDCSDWYKTQVRATGRLEVRVTARPAEAAPPDFRVEIYDSALRPLDGAVAAAETTAQAGGRVGPGSYFSRVRLEDGAMSYEIRARLVESPER